ncbi:MAG: hypothetical protein SGI73_09900 [Chloroflexota bacterium]|nr:hypothetical protein [Chloroflexota bacterium]
MKLFRLLALCSIIALFAFVVPASMAQDQTFGLSDSDFALFTDANATSSAFDTLSYSFTLDLTASGLAESDVNVTLIGSGVLGEQDGDTLFSLDVSGDIGDGTQTMTVDFEARIVDGMIYVNLGDDSGWQGGSLEEIVGQVGSMMGGMTGIDPSTMLEGDSSAMTDMMAQPGVMEAVMGISAMDPADFIAISSANADGLTQFTIDLNIADLLSAPEMGAILGMAMAGQTGDDSATMSDAQMQQMGAMMGMLFSDLVLKFDQYVNSSSLVERSVMTLDFPVPAMLTGGTEANLNMVFDIGLSNYNEPITVEAPAEFAPMSM